ncbi:MAG: hypothetical protein KJ956_10710 [Actinobacteria bacterium]|nr:hypothetical protein [Actinomycetota bacterium]
MSDDQEQPEEVTIVVEDGEAAAEATGSEEAGGDEDVEQRRFRLRRTWSEVRGWAPALVFLGWVAAVLLVAVARIDPWNKGRVWRKWLRADERGWEALIPGLLGAGAAWLVIRAHDRWSDEGWSPEVLAMVLLAAGAAFGGILWGLHVLELRPFAV